jgi:hypothetical protein
MDRRWGGMLGFAMLAITTTAGAGELDWLAGHWCGMNGKTFNEETWMAARGGALVGMHRDTREGKVVGFEFMRIVQQDGGWIFLAQPNGKDVVAFPAQSVAQDRIVFSNPAHDFPNRVIYHRVDADTLQASVDDGSDEGKRLQWIWKRDCVAPGDQAR